MPRIAAGTGEGPVCELPLSDRRASWAWTFHAPGSFAHGNGKKHVYDFTFYLIFILVSVSVTLTSLHLAETPLTQPPMSHWHIQSNLAETELIFPGSSPFPWVTFHLVIPPVPSG